MRGRRRLLAALVVALALAPGTLVRTQVETDPDHLTVTATSLLERARAEGGISGQLTLEAVWHIEADHPTFGGFSAIVDGADADGSTLIIGSDRGWRLDLPMTQGAPVPARASFERAAPRESGMYEMTDLESYARDPATGTLWSGFEYAHAIRRERSDGTVVVRAPPEMRDWNNNSSIETLTRLGDGRFIAVSEGRADDGRGFEGLLWDGDPVEDRVAVSFRLELPADYRPVDAATLPDGSVLVLARRVEVALPARFDALVLRADPQGIEEDEIWRGEVVARFAGDLFGENFEGIAWAASERALYLVSDHNFSIFQRSLLVRLGVPAAWAAPAR